jgi:NAD(P)-dependent dehydrogenase (short-subunit alcohol dehydrogenase family)
MTRKLEGRTALVFGAGSVGPGWGNGKAAAVQYAREGARVVAIDIHQAAADETRDIIASEGGEAISLPCDVTRREQIAETVAAARARFGRIDVLHNNVGLPSMSTLDAITDEDWDLAMNVNLKSVMLCCQAAIPAMLEQGKGAIVNISSIAAIRYTGYPYPSYYASKAAVNHLTVSIALEYASRGIRANAIMPGLMDTPHIYRNVAGVYASKEEMVAARSKLSPTGRMGTAWDIAKAAAFLASDDAEYITGQCLAVDGGLTCRVG